MSEKKFSNFTEDYEDIFATGSLPEQQPAASNDEDEDYETIGNICDTSVMTKMEKKGFFSQEQAKHMDGCKFTEVCGFSITDKCSTECP